MRFFKKRLLAIIMIIAFAGGDLCYTGQAYAATLYPDGTRNSGMNADSISVYDPAADTYGDDIYLPYGHMSEEDASDDVSAYIGQNGVSALTDSAEGPTAGQNADAIPDETEEWVAEDPYAASDLTGEEIIESEDETIDETGDDTSDESDDETGDETEEDLIEEDEPVFDDAVTGQSFGYVEAPNHHVPGKVRGSGTFVSPNGASYLDSKYINKNLSSLRNQNPYGACWAFSSIGMAEMSLRAQGAMSSPDLSELHLAYFAYNTAVDPLEGTEGDTIRTSRPSGILNFGGNYDQSVQVLANWIGAAAESKAPYSSKGASVNKGTRLKESIAYADAAHLEDAYFLNLQEDTEEVKKLIIQYGGVGVNFRSVSGFSAQTTGNLYNEKTNSYYDYIGGMSNHAVMVVGWDDNYSRSKFSVKPPGNGAWLIRNSWTTGSFSANQNYSGYFWMSYYDRGLGETAAAMVFNSADVYDNNYQYDGGITDWPVEVRKAANIFTVSSDVGVAEELKAVSVKLSATDVDYTVYVYSGLTDPDDPESGELRAEQSGTTLYEGIHTIKLDTPVRLNKDETFSVVIDFGGYCQPIAHESDYWGMGGVSGNVCASAGQSFTWGAYGNTLDEWRDFGEENDSNLRIKAYTVDIPGTQILPQSVTVNEEFAGTGLELNKGETATATCTVLPEDATIKRVRWTSSDESVVKVDSHGVITAVDEGTAYVTVKTRSGTASDRIPVTVVSRLTGISIEPPGESYFIVGNKYHFEMNTVPEGATVNSNPVWTVSDPDMLDIDSNGNVTVKDVGNAEISVEADEYSATFDINCCPKAPSVKAVKSGSDVRLTWNAVNGAGYYEVLRIDASAMFGESYERLDTVYISDEDGSYSYTDTEVPDAYKVVYGVQASDSVVTGPVGKAEVYYTTSYKITYKVGKGKNNPMNPVSLVRGEYVNIYDPIPPLGYTAQSGWYESHLKGMTDGLPLEYAGTPKYMKYTLTARYTPVQYKIRYNANGGSGKMSDTVCKYDKKTSLRANSFKKDGYRFIGWNTRPDGTGKTYKNKASIKNLSSTQGRIIKLYAQWGGEEFKITLNAGRGRMLSGKKKVASKTITVANEGKYMDLPQPSMTGYDFLGWFTESTGGTMISNGDIVDKTALPVRTLYAHYEPIQSWAEYDGNGVHISYLGKTVTYDSAYGELPDPVDPDGSHFVGWFAEPECLKRIDSDTVVKQTKEHVLYAGWYGDTTTETPEISIEGAHYSEICDYKAEEGKRVTMKCWTPGAVMLYTLDGTDPSTSDTAKVYTGSFELGDGGPGHTYAMCVIARKNGYLDSDLKRCSLEIVPRTDQLESLEYYDDDYDEYFEKGCPEDLWIAGIDPDGYTYDGLAVKPDFRVYDGRRSLVPGTDYTVKYTNNVNAYGLSEGDEGFKASKAPTITITGKKNYKGTITQYFKIIPVDITSNDALVANPVTVALNGSVIKGTTQVTYAYQDGRNVTLKSGRDYEYLYPGTVQSEDDYDPDAFVAEGDHEAVIRGVGNYTGTATFTETITMKKLISDVRAAAIPDQTFTGDAIEPAISLTSGGAVLEADSDYQVTYTDNVSVGTATAAITGIGDYTGTRIVKFNIKGRSLKNCTISGGWQSSVMYTGVLCTQDAAVVRYSAGKGASAVTEYLAVSADPEDENADCYVTYLKAVNAGTATAVYTGNPARGYTGSFKKTYKITPYVFNAKQHIEDRLYSGCPDSWMYSPGGVRPDPEIYFTLPDATPYYLRKGIDYKLKYYNNKAVTRAGTRKYPRVDIILKGNFKGTITHEFEIGTGYLTEGSISVSDVVYSAKPGKYKAKFTVYDINGSKLKAGKDYGKNVLYTYAADTWLDEEHTVFRRHDTKVQKNDVVPAGCILNVVVTGYKNYTGTIIGQYRVTPKDLSKAKVTVPGRAFSGRYWIVKPEDITVKVNGVTLDENDFYIDEYKNNLNTGTASFVIHGKGDYGGSQTVKFNIGTKKLTIR